MPGLTGVAGIEVGHDTDRTHGTGCTVVVCRPGAVGGVDVRGSAPGTRETDLLRPGNLVEHVHAILLTGGSAYGLDAATGVMRWLEEQGVGFRMGRTVVPIVAGAVIFDLGLITAQVRPDAAAGYRACQSLSAAPVPEGSVGAGTGATVGKALGLERAVKGGIGTAAVRLPEGITVAALVVANAWGDVVDPATGRVVAGPRREDAPGFLSTIELLLTGRVPRAAPTLPTTTTIGVVATDARLSKEQANKLASLAQDGLALAVRPCHTMRDGDTIFVMATGGSPAPVEPVRLGAAAVEAVAQATLRAIETADGLGGVPSVQELAT